jgi:Predicted membrane protein
VLKEGIVMLIVIMRSVILYAVVLVVMRIMGKRQIGQLQPFELVITIIISELAAVPMQDTGIPLLYGILPIVILMIAQILLSFLSLKSEKARGIICGKPNILIENGKIKERELSKLYFNINDLLEQLRVLGYPDVQDVEFAILETEGQLSVIPKATKRPVTPKDMNLQVQQEKLPITLIIDGEVIKENLRIAKMNRDNLTELLNKNNVSSYKSVLFAGLDSSGKFFYQEKLNSGK